MSSWTFKCVLEVKSHRCQKEMVSRYPRHQSKSSESRNLWLRFKYDWDLNAQCSNSTVDFAPKLVHLSCSSVAFVLLITRQYSFVHLPPIIDICALELMLLPSKSFLVLKLVCLFTSKAFLLCFRDSNLLSDVKLLTRHWNIPAFSVRLPLSDQFEFFCRRRWAKTSEPRSEFSFSYCPQALELIVYESSNNIQAYGA